MKNRSDNNELLSFLSLKYCNYFIYISKNPFLIVTFLTERVLFFISVFKIIRSHYDGAANLGSKHFA